MKKIVWLVICSLSMISIEAQKHEFLNPPKFNEADLSKTKSDIDDKAPAEILYRSVHFYIDTSSWYLRKKIFYRVKIYDKDRAVDWLNLEVPLYQNGSNKETLNKMRAFTYNLENENVVSVKVDKSSKYKSKESKNVTVTKFAFPNVKNGSVIEYEYEIVSPFLYYVPQVLIELDTPSLYTEYILDAPSNISYNMNYTGSLTPKYRENEERILYGVSHRTYRFGYDKLKGFKTEKFVKNDKNFRTKISAELHSTNFKDLKLYSSSWENIKNRLYEAEDFGGELKKTRLAKENLPDLSGANTEIEKANVIFDYVKNSFSWNKDSGIYTEDGIKKMLENKTGNAAEINLFLVMLLREAGLKANPVIISTVSNGLLNLVSPSLSNTNFVIAAVNTTKDGFHVYDATSKQSSVDNLPPRDWNDYGILLEKNKAMQLQLVNAMSSFNYLTTTAKINDDGSISGTYRDRDTGTFAMLAKESHDENIEKYRKQYKDNYTIDFNNIDSKVLENGDFESVMEFTSDNLIDRVGKKLIINPMLFMSKKSNEFDQVEERKFGIDFISPFSRVKKVVLEIPEGFTVEELPKNKKIITEDKEIEYSYVAELKGNKLEVISTTKVMSPDYPKEYYPAFKRIWQVASQSENQVISIVKK